MRDHSVRFEQLIEGFEEAWESGLPCVIKEVLGEAPENERWPLLIELVKIDMERRWRDTSQGGADSTLPKRPLLEDYAQVLGELGPVERMPIDLVAEEYRIRRLCGEHPRHEDYIRRFGLDPTVWTGSAERVEQELLDETPSIRSTRQAAASELPVFTRCPHCQNKLKILADADSQQIVCDACGSAVRLLGTHATTLSVRSSRMLGHFQLINRIGAGHFGEVWSALDMKLGRTVAVKFPRKGILSAAEKDNFLREARAVAHLKHPRIVPVHEVGSENETVFIVSDYIQGATLRERLRNKRLSAEEVAELCAQIADGLHHAHEAGVIHRDLKPSNIMLDLDGQPHIMDFGLAKRIAGEARMTVDGQILGTPAYMSPEQAMGDKDLTS